MSYEHYLGEIRLFAGETVPEGWLPCDGRTLSASEYPDLAVLLKANFGGTEQDFALPNLVGSVPIGAGAARTVGGKSYFLGERGGTTEVTLTHAHLPAHTHPFQVTPEPANTAEPAKKSSTTMLAAPNTPNDFFYVKPKTTANTGTLHTDAIKPAGGGKSHSNMMPTFALGYIIAVRGEFPAD